MQVRRMQDVAGHPQAVQLPTLRLSIHGGQRLLPDEPRTGHAAVRGRPGPESRGDGGDGGRGGRGGGRGLEAPDAGLVLHLQLLVLRGGQSRSGPEWGPCQSDGLRGVQLLRQGERRAFGRRRRQHREVDHVAEGVGPGAPSARGGVADADRELQATAGRQQGLHGGRRQLHLRRGAVPRRAALEGADAGRGRGAQTAALGQQRWRQRHQGTGYHHSGGAADGLGELLPAHGHARELVAKHRRDRRACRKHRKAPSHPQHQAPRGIALRRGHRKPGLRAEALGEHSQSTCAARQWFCNLQPRSCRGS
mmetsp:Transcript_71089/g.230787  ORF Transcript_71089/g.230787 Transcript_71089/m.230787 type:complete len:307 (+) Transcript_71089:1388-2308(+)